MTLRTPRSASLLLAVLLVLSGCVGGNSDVTGGERGEVTSTRESDPTTDADAVLGRSTVHPLSARPLSTSHTASLRDAESFTLNYAMTMTLTDHGESRTFTLDWTARADLSTDERHITMNTTGFGAAVGDTSSTIHTELYVTPDGHTFQRMAFDDFVQYQRVDEETYNVTLLLTAMGVTTELDPASTNLTYAGTTTFDGDRMYVYTASDLGHLYAPSDGVARFEDDSVTVSDLRLVVDEAGTVRALSYDVEFVDDEAVTSVTFELTYTDIGSTSVERPDWVGEAEAETVVD